MRKANKVIADRKKNLPDKYKIVDNSVNKDVESLSKNQKGIEKHLFPLRIDQRKAEACYLFNRRFLCL